MEAGGRLQPERLAVGFKRLDNVNALARWGYDLKVTCKSCGHTAVLSALRLSMLAGPNVVDRSLDVIKRRLFCSCCRSRDLVCVTVERVRTEDQPPPRRWGPQA